MTKDKIQQFATIIGAVGVILGAVGAVLMPFAKNYITNIQIENLRTPRFKFESKGLIDEYLQSAEFKILTDEIIRNHEIHLSDDHLREDIANKMGVDPDEVHIIIGKIPHRLDEIERILSSFDKERNQPQNDTNQ